MTPRDPKTEPNKAHNSERHFDVLIIGAGAAGCYAALNLSDLRVGLISPTPLGGDSSSLWAQGGIAAAVDTGDTPQLHQRDTIKAGAGTTDINIAKLITETAPLIIQDLDQKGVEFDRNDDGYLLNREACHTMRRVLKAKAGDGFGKALMLSLIEHVKAAPHITVLFPYTLERLNLNETAQINSAYVRYAKSRKITQISATSVIIATGGIGGLYETTTNPLSSVGRGIAIAAVAGAELSDLEFVQFHPTALDIGLDPAPLATEALRGEGARLINDQGDHFMDQDHPMKELAPRDVVSRSIFSQLKKGRTVYLDCTMVDTYKFPALRGACAKVGIDPQTTPVRVRPAVHYHMGGVATNQNGKTSLNCLWAVGEVAATGLHGANRLASNSLLEALVMGQRAALDVQQKHIIAPISKHQTHISIPEQFSAKERQMYKKHIRQIMESCVGVVREESELQDALQILNDICDYAATRDIEIYDMAFVGTLIATSALLRTESRGGHFRRDYPQSKNAWKKRSFRTSKDISLIKPIYEAV